MSSIPQKQTLPPQHQDQQPGIESEMTPRPESVAPHYKARENTFRADQVAVFGGNTPMKRNQPASLPRAGSVTVKLDPTPSSLSTRIRPP